MAKKRLVKNKIEFPPFLCNERCPRKTKHGYRLSTLSHISLPPGTRIHIFENVDPEDPSSDCEMREVTVAGLDARLAVLAEPISVRGVE